MYRLLDIRIMSTASGPRMAKPVMANNLYRKSQHLPGPARTVRRDFLIP